MSRDEHTSSRPADTGADMAEWNALLRLCAWAGLFALGALWFISLPFAALLLFAFDSQVSVPSAIGLGMMQATWVAAVPIALLFAAHLAANGQKWPEWGLRWLVVGGAAIVWCAILAFWILAATSD